MPTKNWDVFFNELFQGYLTAPASLEAGVPNAETCPIRIAQSTENVTRPMVVISHLREEMNNLNVYHAKFTVDLQILDQTDTDQTTAEGWLQKIRRRLANRPALEAYILSLSEQDKQGWQPTVLWMGSGAMERDWSDEERGHLSLRVGFTWICVVQDV